MVLLARSIVPVMTTTRFLYLFAACWLSRTKSSFEADSFKTYRPWLVVIFPANVLITTSLCAGTVCWQVCCSCGAMGLWGSCAATVIARGKVETIRRLDTKLARLTLMRHPRTENSAAHGKKHLLCHFRKK